MELAIVKYIKKFGLKKTVNDFKLDIKEYPDKILLKYNMINSSMDCPEVQEARGLILEKDTWKVINMSFLKFFNVEEPRAAKIDLETAHILQKCDGSLSQVYFFNNQWFMATSGTAEGESEVNNKPNTTFSDLFWTTVEKMTGNVELFKSKLVKGRTYAFELCTPYNIVVTPHTTSSVTLLMVRDLETLQEFSYEDVTKMAKDLGILMVKRFSLQPKDFGELKRTLDNMPFSEEGYVVLDKNFNRVKVKNPKYLAAHHLKGKSAFHHILDIIKANEVDEFVATFVERKDEILMLKANHDNLLTRLELTWTELQSHLPKNITPAEKKRFAEAVFVLSKKNDVMNFTGCFFGLRDSKVKSIREFVVGFDNRKLYSILS